MEWWIIAALAVALLIMISVYRIALRENRALTNFVLLVLLDSKVYEAQRASVAEFVRAIEAKSAADLGIKTALATQSASLKLAHTVLGTNGLLWKLKQSARS
jgi:hypothetical protein